MTAATTMTFEERIAKTLSLHQEMLDLWGSSFLLPPAVHAVNPEFFHQAPADRITTNTREDGSRYSLYVTSDIILFCAHEDGCPTEKTDAPTD